MSFMVHCTERSCSRTSGGPGGTVENHFHAQIQAQVNIIRIFKLLIAMVHQHQYEAHKLVLRMPPELDVLFAT